MTTQQNPKWENSFRHTFGNRGRQNQNGTVRRVTAGSAGNEPRARQWRPQAGDDRVINPLRDHAESHFPNVVSELTREMIHAARHGIGLKRRLNNRRYSLF